MLFLTAMSHVPVPPPRPALVCSLFLINSSDRVVRIYDTEMILSDACDVEEPDALQKMQDLVNR